MSNEMFADDTLDYDVNEGVGTVSGALDSQDELTALRTRIAGVPGVRDVIVTSVAVGRAEM